MTGLQTGLFYFLFLFLAVLTACNVISSTIDFLAAIKSRTNAARGNNAVIENDMSLRLMNMSMASQIWNPNSISALSMHTLA